MKGRIIMSYLKAYKVSTCRKHVETIAIVQSGNSRGAVWKFVFHVYPEISHDDMEKLPSTTIDGGKISNYRFHSADGDFTVSAEKINLTSDFIPIDQHVRARSMEI
jgi:hypothetical protein